MTKEKVKIDKDGNTWRGNILTNIAPVCTIPSLKAAFDKKMSNQFDITKHKWRDSSVECDSDYINSGVLKLYCSGEIFIEKRDAIAIAKHFGIYHD